ELLRRLADALLRLGHRALRPAGEEGRLLSLLLQSVARLVDALLDRALLTAHLVGLGLVRARRARLLLERRFLPRHLEHLLDRLVERSGQLLLPLRHLLLARVLKVLRRLVHLLRRALGVLRSHLLARGRRVLLRGRGLLCTRLRFRVFESVLELLHIVREALRAIGELSRVRLRCLGVGLGVLPRLLILPGFLVLSRRLLLSRLRAVFRRLVRRRLRLLVRRLVRRLVRLFSRELPLLLSDVFRL